MAFDVDADILRRLGVLPATLRGCVAGKMDDHLAAKPFSGDDLAMMGNLLRQSVDLFRGIPLGDGVSEQDRASSDALRAEVVGVVRERAAAHWLIAPTACVHQTMHAELAPADRLFVASYRFCVVLLMIDMRRFGDPAFLPLQRHTTTSPERRWVYNDETWRELMGHESCSLRLRFFVVWERSSSPFEPTFSAL
jgi:hypothetical protein